MPETTQETCASAKESPFFIKNLLNCDSKPAKPKPALAVTKAALDGGFPLSQVGDFNFPRFDLPTQRFSLPAHYLERTSAWWYPYALSSSSHIHRSEGKAWCTENGEVSLVKIGHFSLLLPLDSVLKLSVAVGRVQTALWGK